MNCPTTVAELQALVDNSVQEDLHLDYKSSAIFEKTRDDLKLDLAKDVSAFANSDGGNIVYGIIESATYLKGWMVAQITRNGIANELRI